MFDLQKLEIAFNSIAHCAASWGEHINLHIVGGAALLLATTCREQAGDIDALTVITDRYDPFLASQGINVFDRSHNQAGLHNRRLLHQANETISKTHAHIPAFAQFGYWMHTPLTTTHSDTRDFIPYGTYIDSKGHGLSVWLAPPELILAMKLSTKFGRRRAKDRIDCAKLAIALNLSTHEDFSYLIALHASRSPKLLFSDLTPDLEFSSEDFKRLSFDIGKVSRLLEKQPEAQRPAIKKFAPKLMSVASTHS